MCERSSELALTEAGSKPGFTGFKRFQIVSLFDIIAAKIGHLAGLLHDLDVIQFSKEEFECDHIDITLREIRQFCHSLDLEHSKDKIDNATQFTGLGVFLLNKHGRETLRDISLMVVAELKKKLFLTLSVNERKLFEGDVKLSADMLMKFKKANYDLIEAGKCLATDRTTACVFHVSRALELATYRLAAITKVKKGVRDTMGSVVKKIGVKIEEWCNVKPITKQVDRRAKKYSEIKTFLSDVVVAWRNPTMHVERTYTQAHAQEIYNTTMTFFERFAAILPSPRTKRTASN